MGNEREVEDFRDDMISMHEIDPSPVEESPVDVMKGDYFPQDNSAPPPAALTRSSSLGLSGHNTVWWLNRIQRYSSYAFTTFLTFHITNTSLIPLVTRSLPASDTYLLLTRPYYQSPLLEPALIVLPLALHITSGLALRIYRRQQTTKWYGAENRDERHRIPWPKLSGTSAVGYALVPLVVGHAFVNRVIPLWVDGGSSGIGLEYVAHGFAKHPAVAFAGYATLVGAGSWHFAWGWAKWMGWTPDGTGSDAVDKGLRRKRRWYGVNIVATLLAGLWMAGGLGVVARGGKVMGWLGKGYDELYQSVPIFGKLL